MLANMHKDVVHRGKVPERALARMSRKRRLDQLESDLQEAIKLENYEEAARLRDLISQAKASINVS
jgi:protein arginine kinase activator